MNFAKSLAWLVAVLLAAFSAPSLAALEVFACEPEWGALARELGGAKVNVYDATNALQDPHRVEAKPSLLARSRSADLLVCSGAELEVGWLPIVLRQSGNPKIQPGRSGYFEATQFVRLREIPARLDRAEGDVHAGGNPHIQTDPRNLAKVADGLARRLAEIDPANAAHYAARHRDFAMRWQAALSRWEQAAASLKGVSIVVQHKGFPYLEDWLGLKQVAALEPKPGIEPSVAHLAQIAQVLQNQPAKMVLRAAYQDGRASTWLAERTAIPVVVLPYTVGGSEKAKDLFGLFDDTVEKLLQGVK